MFKNKYLKYKQKYLDLKNQIGGVDSYFCKYMLTTIFIEKHLEAYIRKKISQNGISEFNTAPIEFIFDNSPRADHKSFYKFMVNGQEIGHLTIFDDNSKSFADKSFHFTFFTASREKRHCNVTYSRSYGFQFIVRDLRSNSINLSSYVDASRQVKEIGSYIIQFLEDFGFGQLYKRGDSNSTDTYSKVEMCPISSSIYKKIEAQLGDAARQLASGGGGGLINPSAAASARPVVGKVSASAAIGTAGPAILKQEDDDDDDSWMPDERAREEAEIDKQIRYEEMEQEMEKQEQEDREHEASVYLKSRGVIAPKKKQIDEIVRRHEAMKIDNWRWVRRSDNLPEDYSRGKGSTASAHPGGGGSGWINSSAAAYPRAGSSSTSATGMMTQIKKLDESLHSQVKFGTVDSLEKLLRKNPPLDINGRNRDELTPLMCVVDYGIIDPEGKVRLLLEYGADRDLQNYYGETALALAKKDKNLTKVRELLTNYRPNVSRDVILARRAGRLTNQSATSSAYPGGSGSATLSAYPGGSGSGLSKPSAASPKPDAQEEEARRVASLNIIHLDGYTQLTSASREGNNSLVESLIARGAVVDKRDKYGDTALIWASANGHETVVESLIQAKASVNLQDLKYQNTPLIWASHKGHERIVDSLIRAKADVNMQNNKDETALIMASERGHESIVAALIRAGASVDIQTMNGDTALMIASLEGQKRYGYGNTIALLRQAEALVKMARDVPSHLVNFQDSMKGNTTPLMYHALMGTVQSMKNLLDKGANPDIRDTMGWTALHHAIHANDIAKVRVLLLEYGADKTIKNNNNQTPYDLAKYYGYYKIMELLLTY